MPQVVEIDELDAGQCLATFGHLRATRENADRDILLLCAHFADLYDVDSRAGQPAPGRGRERPVRLGGEQTPVVWEFAVAEAAAELGLTTWSARRLLADALDVRHRLPRLWRGLTHGEVLAGLARKVAQATRELTADQASGVDEAIVGYADGRLPFSRFMGRLEGLVVAADPVAATQRERTAREEEFAKVGQSNDHGQRTLYVRTGAAQMARIDATIAFYADALAALGDTDPLDKRRSKAVLLLANPAQAVALLQALAGQRDGQRTTSSTDGEAPDGQDGNRNHNRNQGGRRPPESPPPLLPPEVDELDLDLGSGGPQGSDPPEAQPGDAPDDGTRPPPEAAEAVVHPFFAPFRPTSVPPCACQGGGFLLDAAAMLPQVTLYLHGHAESLARGDGVVRWEGLGPITGDYLRTVLGPHARFTVKPVLDPEGIPPADSYEIPAAMAEALHVRTPFDVFPFGASTGRDKQKDHTVAFDFGEQAAGCRPESQTGLHNLGGMTTFHHRVKTHGRWQVRQPFPGVYLWRSPHGSMFYVDNTGTRQLHGPRHRRGPADRDAPGPPEGVGLRTRVTEVLYDEGPSEEGFRRFLEAS